MDSSLNTPAPGTQVVSRTARLLRIVSESVPNGISSSDVARKSGLTRPTTYRLLNALANEGLLDFDASNTTWHLGPDLFLLGNLAAHRYDITDIAQPIVREIAEITGESSFLSARRGDETVCILREEGAFPIRSFVLSEGVRFPLGVASAGLAILSFLTERERTHYLNQHDLVNAWGASHSREQLEQRVARTTASGFAVNPGLIVEGSWGIGAAVFDPAGHPAWALSITGIESRFRPERQQQLGALLVQKAHQLTQQVRGQLQ